MIGPLLDVARPAYPMDPVARHHPLHRGRLAWWLVVPGLEGGRYWYDLMGRYPAALEGLFGWGRWARPGSAGRATFDGTSVRGVAGAVPMQAPLTMLATVSVTNFSDYRTIFGSSSSGGPQLRVDASSATLTLNAENVAGVGSSSGTLTAGVPARVGVTYTGSAYAFYINGLPAGSGSTSQSFAQSSLIIGQNGSSGGEWFAGSMDDATVYGRALSAAEVAADYASSRLGHPGLLNRARSRSAFIYLPSDVVAPSAPGPALPLLGCG